LISKSIENNRKWWNGKKVISVSNGYQVNPDDESLSIGTVVDVVAVSQANVPTPLVLFEGETEPNICFSTIMEYTDDLWENLKRHTAEERWMMIRAFCERF